MELPSTMRSARVDLLRGVAIFLVLLLNISLTYDLTGNGNYGVTIFFVISGYLITSNNLQRYQCLRQVRLRQFYAFRFSRIIPLLILALRIIVTLGPVESTVAEP
jgi:peptidoglycan/LPS O-acetylase OafA/YrhL